MAILWTILETWVTGTPTLTLSRILVSDACMKSEQNLLRMKKVIVCQRNTRRDKQTDGQSENYPALIIELTLYQTMKF